MDIATAKATNMAEPRLIYIGLGGNVGKVDDTFGQVAVWLHAAHTHVVRQSRLYTSAPVGGVAQANFLNAVFELRTCLPPEELLQYLQVIEEKFGRDRTKETRWGPRTIDLDYLLDDAWPTYQTETLTLPHPRIWERAFTICPLGDLIPNRQAPIDIPVIDLAKILAETQGIMVFNPLQSRS
jgi:2-amino-4-hydroxy-6-hydroxymethyldihydropteridine diphosphokinase